ncbi:MAG: hypothetical protein O6834_03975 [Actinobacteria bacterium]|nr:hypothetical protein [Actinomycetota bacterium]
MHPHTAQVLAEARIDDLRREANRSPNPPQFTSFVLATADAQGRPSYRVRYRQEGEMWIKERLAP